LPLVHNLIYGDEFTVFTTNAGSSDVVGVEPSKLLDLPSDSPSATESAISSHARCTCRQ
jgi:hypothetical protein